MTMAEMMRKLESLEKRVAELEKRPANEVHYHTHQGEPAYQPVLIPRYDTPYIPDPTTIPPTWIVTCGKPSDQSSQS